MADHTTSAPAPDRDALGRVVAGRYRLVAPIGRGASAEVYEAEDLRLRRRVAVKLLHPGLAADPRFAERFRHEAQLAAPLSHPNLLAVYDWGDDDGVYLVTELLAGGSLRDLLATRHHCSTSQALAIGLEAARGLAAAHRRGLVHRDIKPANLLFGLDGHGPGQAHRLRVADFGIARAVAEAAWTEPEGVLIGTARYAAPEQAVGGTVTGAADVYALSLTLIEAVTQHVPLVGESALATMVKRQHEPIEAPEQLGPLADLLTECGAVDPSARPSAEDLERRLTALARRLPRPEPLPLPDPDDPRPIVDVAAPDPVVDVREPAFATTNSLQTDLGRPPAEETSLGVEVEEPPHRRRWPLVLGLLAVLLLAAGAVAAVLVAQRTPTPRPFDGIAVADVVGLDATEAAGRLEADGLPTRVVEVFRTDVEAGDVVAQLPPAGWPTVSEGAGMVLVASAGPDQRIVPTLVGLPLDEATEALVAAGFEVGEVAEAADEEAEPGVVTGSSAETGTELTAGSVVDLTVSSGPRPRIVPPVVGLTRDEAIAAIEAEGLVVGEITEEFSDEVPEGVVMESSPDPGDDLDRGDTVDLEISRGVPFFEVPNVVGLDADDAADGLEDAGFVVVGTVGPPNDPVTRTDPPAGEFHREGHEITIYTR